LNPIASSFRPGTPKRVYVRHRYCQSHSGDMYPISLLWRDRRGP